MIYSFSKNEIYMSLTLRMIVNLGPALRFIIIPKFKEHLKLKVENFTLGTPIFKSYWKPQFLHDPAVNVHWNIMRRKKMNNKHLLTVKFSTFTLKSILKFKEWLWAWVVVKIFTKYC